MDRNFFKTRWSIIVSILICSVFYYLINPFTLDPKQCSVTTIALLMISLWISEAMPLAIVSLIPMLTLPLLGLMKWDELSTAYSSPMIYLFMGGFILSLAIEKWQLHRRIALNIIQYSGTRSNRIILGFIIATGFISMWLSNTATTMMMFPIALAIIKMMEHAHPNHPQIKNFGISILIVIAYASNFGGIATIIGTPPNVAFNSFLDNHYHQNISFVKWMMICGPLSIVILGILYIVISKIMFPIAIEDSVEVREYFQQEINLLGKMTDQEKKVLLVFLLTAGMWITKDLWNQILPVKLDDTWIALFGALLLFIIPADQDKALLDWSDAQKMSWGILLLFGGGIALANALDKVGVLQIIGNAISSFSYLGPSMILLLVIVISIFLSEVMSNVAQVIVLSPIVVSIADSMQMSGFQLGLAMTLAASCASMLPMGTPPNAIAFSSGLIPINSMLKTGFVMNLICIVLIFIFCQFVMPLVVGL